MNPRQILVGVVSILVANAPVQSQYIVSLTPQVDLLTAEASAKDGQQQEPRRVNISQLEKSLNAELRNPSLKTQKWYAKGKDYGSDRAVIIVIETHDDRMQKGVYNPIFDIVSRPKHSLMYGLESVAFTGPVNSRPALESLLSLRAPFNVHANFTFEDMLKEDKFAAHIVNSNAVFYGLENEDYLIEARCVQSLAQSMLKFFREKFDSGLTEQQQTFLIGNLGFLYGCAKSIELPPYKPEIWQDRNKFQVYLDALDKVYFRVSNIERSKIFVSNVLTQLDSNLEANRFPNIIAAQVGGLHLDDMTRTFDSRRISYIFISNPELDLRVKGFKKILEPYR